MDFMNRIIASIVFCGLSINGIAQTLTGCVVGKDDRKPIAYASVTLKENRLYAFTDEKGCFTIKNVPKGKCTAVISCLGYAEQTVVVTINNDGATLNVRLAEDNLQLDEVQVVAHRKKDEITTSYTIDRKTLDNQQIMTLGDIAQLLPGGKSVNPSLMNDSKLTLRSGSSERGNASFGTAIEVDGVRLNNNAMMGETAGVSTRGVSASNIESVEVVPGIASVEYGDLTNGVVKVKTRRGSSPFILEGSINQHTRQIALHKGLDLGKNTGLINFSLEHARSFSDAASPYTAYQRNVLSLHYMNVFMKKTQPLTLDIGLNGGVGGYDSKADPDRNLDSYYKVKDNNVGGNVRLDWLLNKSWITNLNFTAAFTYADKRSESYSNESSSSTQPYIHTLTEGYNIAEDYDKNPSANIILGPTGYWYLRVFGDSKPLTYSLKLKANWNKFIWKDVEVYNGNESLDDFQIELINQLLVNKFVPKSNYLEQLFLKCYGKNNNRCGEAIKIIGVESYRKRIDGKLVGGYRITNGRRFNSFVPNRLKSSPVHHQFTSSSEHVKTSTINTFHCLVHQFTT